MALTNCIIHQPIMLTFYFAIKCFHIARLSRKILTKKFFKIPFSNKTNSCAIFFCCRRKIRFLGNLTNSWLFQDYQSETSLFQVGS